MTITEFLLARVAEDEAAHPMTKWQICPMPRVGGGRAPVSFLSREDAADHIEVLFGRGFKEVSVLEAPRTGMGRDLAERVLAECRAKRALVDLERESWLDSMDSTERPNDYPEGPQGIVLRVLASVYADHPDYDMAWCM